MRCCPDPEPWGVYVFQLQNSNRWKNMLEAVSMNRSLANPYDDASRIMHLDFGPKSSLSSQ